MKKCVFWFEAMGKEQCRALTRCSCQGCPFFKTDAQLEAERRAAERRLKKLGLKAIEKRRDGGLIMSTTEDEE